MKIYIAAKSQEEARKIAKYLESKGHTITARWIAEAGYGTTEKTDADKINIARHDHNGVRDAEAMVFRSEPDKSYVPGGKHVEMGMAIVLGIPVYVIGHKENVFHWHPNVSHFETMENLPL